MNDHLSDDELIGNIHRTLTDAQRESMEVHLAACPQCRARLSDNEAMQQRIRHNLLADLRGVQPSADMRFESISAQVRGDKVQAFRRISHQLFPTTVASVALIGLLFALVDLPESIVRLFTNPEPASASSFSALACVFFSVATVGNYRESRFNLIAVVRDVVSWLVFLLSGNIQLAFALGNLALLPLGLIWIAVVIGSAEYQYRRGSQRISWKLFAWIIAVELSILILTLLI
jgi:hypothetical protein